MIFMLGAFVAATFLMHVILVLQFNSFFQAFVVMSAIIFSVAGVLLGLIVTGRPFGVVMGGIGIIALAGIVVNNNIARTAVQKSWPRKWRDNLAAGSVKCCHFGPCRFQGGREI